MKLKPTQKMMLTASLFFVLLVCQLISSSNKTIPLQNKTDTFISQSDSPTGRFDTSDLFQKKVIPNRIPLFIDYLNSKNIQIHNDYELLLLLSNPYTRQKLTKNFHLDPTLLLLHAELADLLQIGMNGIDAQILHFSQRNYQNPFTGATINRHLLVDTEAENILEDIGGWLSGNDDPIIANYQLSLEEIEMWITKAKDNKWNFFAEMP